MNMMAYFDKSGTHDGSPVMCVAGYLLSAEQSFRLDREWAECLREFEAHVTSPIRRCSCSSVNSKARTTGCWKNQFAPLLNKLSTFIINPLLRTVIGEARSSFDFC